MHYIILSLGSGCGTVGGVFASDNRDLEFESNHRQFLFALKCMQEMKIKENESKNINFIY